MDPLTSLAFFVGTWTCNGVFPSSGKTIASAMTFSGDLSGKALVKHHDDRPPSTYHAIEVWVYSDSDKRYNAAIADNFGGVREFASPG
ncbi:MAG: hypothetical protein JO302_07460, partial [Candidatus Eremiobacteraeota bacterium]|nr:hypothetical protein [Candidatus Eremiobacteraeota bacterium]